MILFPEVQARAHAEIDAVIGDKRLPTFEDRQDLPYIEALMQEVRYDDIRVSCVMPGSVATGFGRGSSPAGAQPEWKLAPEDVAQVVMDLLHHPARSLPSAVELRPSKPPKKG